MGYVGRGLNQEGGQYSKSICDLYKKGISTGSMSKTYSLAGLRLGWIVTAQDTLESIFKHRDYNTISVGMINDFCGSLALECKTVYHEEMELHIENSEENNATLSKFLEDAGNYYVKINHSNCGEVTSECISFTFK